MTDGRVVIETERLLLRAWRPDDAEAYNVMCGDPALILTLGGPPTMSESRDVVTLPALAGRAARKDAPLSR